MERKAFFKIIFLLLALLILISGCKGKKDTSKSMEEIRTGTSGIVMVFMPNAPPEKIHVEKGFDNSFEVVLDIRNKGAYPQPGDGIGIGPRGKVFLSGYDPNIITFKLKDNADLSSKTLEGKSSINPNGGQDILTFGGDVRAENLNVEKYEPILLATVCYGYETVAGPSVCIDPDPYSVTQKKVCEVKDITLASQGAPVAITKIDEEAFAAKTQFKITIKNIGGGDVIKDILLDKCDPSSGGKIEREDIDKVEVEEVKISDKHLQCGPYAEGEIRGQRGLIRLTNGEGTIICELPKSAYESSSAAFITPLAIKLSYLYRTTIEKKLLIKKEVTYSEREKGIVPPPPSERPPEPYIEYSAT